MVLNMRKWLSFLLHKYSAEHYSPVHMKHNFRELLSLEPGEWLDCDMEGKLRRLKTGWSRLWFRLRNLFTCGAFQSRLVKAVFFTLLTGTIELNNPFHRALLIEYLERKIAFIERLRKRVQKINGKKWPTEALDLYVAIFRRNSLLQNQIIIRMEKAVRGQKKTELHREIEAALKKGLHPLLVTEGCSGSYWMRGTDRQIMALFKPFDEDNFAPNNPVGPRLQASLGQRRMRPGVRSGEAAHREVAAFVIDQFFGFGIVPRTYYARFTHHTFYSAREDILSGRRVAKTKMGSLQEFIEGFIPLNKLPKEEWSTIPLDELHLLIVLDVILGNADRHTNNMLVGLGKIAAIDHALSLPDIPAEPSTWYWSRFEQAKQPLLPAIAEIVLNFPFERLSSKLRKRCEIELSSLYRMRERVALFAAGVRAGHTLADLAGLMTLANLEELMDLNSTLCAKAGEIVSKYTPPAHL